MPSSRVPVLVTGAGALAAAVAAAAWWTRHQSALLASADAWVVTTVLRSQDEIADSTALAPVTALGSAVELELRDAPGDRGTEVALRWRLGQESGSRDRLRVLLQELKQTLEVGEVLRVTPRPEGHRPPTPGGALIDLADRRSGGKGVL